MKISQDDVSFLRATQHLEEKDKNFIVKYLIDRIKQAKQEVYDKLDNIPMESYTFTEYKKIKENDLGKETKGVNTNQERNS